MISDIMSTVPYTRPSGSVLFFLTTKRPRCMTCHCIILRYMRHRDISSLLQIDYNLCIVQRLLITHLLLLHYILRTSHLYTSYTSHTLYSILYTLFIETSLAPILILYIFNPPALLPLDTHNTTLFGPLTVPSPVEWFQS